MPLEAGVEIRHRPVAVPPVPAGERGHLRQLAQARELRVEPRAAARRVGRLRLQVPSISPRLAAPQLPPLAQLLRPADRRRHGRRCLMDPAHQHRAEHQGDPPGAIAPDTGHVERAIFAEDGEEAPHVAFRMIERAPAIVTLILQVERREFRKGKLLRLRCDELRRSRGPSSGLEQPLGDPSLRALAALADARPRDASIRPTRPRGADRCGRHRASSFSGAASASSTRRRTHADALSCRCFAVRMSARRS